jgi:hypothetical protein
MPARRSGNRAHPVGEPAVVGADAGAPVLVLGGGRRPGEEDEAREKRRHGVREHDLAHDPVGLELPVPQLVVPVAGPAVPAQVGERVPVLAPPRVEIVEIPGLQVLAIRLVTGPGVAVGRDDRVVVGARHRHRDLAPHAVFSGCSFARRVAEG